MYAQTALVPGLIGSSSSVASVVAFTTWTQAAPPPAELDVGNINAIEAWIKPTEFTDAQVGTVIVRLNNTTADNGWALQTLGVGTTTGKLKASWEIAGVGISAESDDAVLTVGSTYHVVAVFNGFAIALYVNGVLVASTAGTDGVGHTGNNRMTVAANPNGQLRLIAGFDEISVYNDALTSLDVASLFNESEQVARTRAVVYNPAAVEPIWSKSLEREIDVAGIWDSNGIYTGTAEDDLGHFHASSQALNDMIAPPYGIGVGPLEPSGAEWGAVQQDVQYRSTLYVSDALPDWLADITLSQSAAVGTVMRNTHVYIADGNETSVLRDSFIFERDGTGIHDPDEHLEYHITAANFKDGTGTNNFRFGIRTGSLFQTLNSSYQQTVNGVDELVDYVFDIPAGDRGGSDGFQIAIMPILAGSAAAGDKIVGPFYAAYQQVKYPDRTPGPRVNVLMAASGHSARDCANALHQCTTESIAEHLRQLTRLQSGGEPMLIVDISHLINDIADTESLSAWNSATGAFDSIYRSNEADGCAANHAKIMSEIQAGWSYLGYNPDNLRFVIGPTHPKNDGDVTVNGVTKTHVRWLDVFYDVMRYQGWTNATIIKGNELVTVDEMIAAGAYQAGGSAHLTSAGYALIATRKVQALIDAIGMPQKELTLEQIAANVWDRLLSNINTSGSVGEQVKSNLSTFDAASDTVDVGSISGDSSAADNLEDMLSGSGGRLTLSTSMDGVPALTILASGLSTPALQISATGIASSAIELIDQTGSGIEHAGEVSGLVNGVWNKLTAGLTTDDSVGKLITDNLDAQVSAAGGLTAAQEAKVDAIKTKTDTIGPDGVSVTLGSNIAADGITLTLIQGEAKLASLNNALTIDITDTRLTAAITGDATVPVLRIAGSGSQVSHEGTVTSFDDGTKTATCSFDLTAVQTAALPAGKGNKWELDWKLAGSATNLITSVIDAPCVVKRQIAT